MPRSAQAAKSTCRGEKRGGGEGGGEGRSVPGDAAKERSGNRPLGRGLATGVGNTPVLTRTCLVEAGATHCDELDPRLCQHLENLASVKWWWCRGGWLGGVGGSGGRVRLGATEPAEAAAGGHSVCIVHAQCAATLGLMQGSHRLAGRPSHLAIAGVVHKEADSGAAVGQLGRLLVQAGLDELGAATGQGPA